MIKWIIGVVVGVLIAIAFFGCAGPAKLKVEQGMGPDPVLPEPESGLLPTFQIPKAVGWPPDQTPRAASGFIVNRYADQLDHPRWLYVLPNGDVLVAESNSQPRKDKGLRGVVMKKMMARAGAGAPSADRISLLRDADGDGIAELKTVFLEDLTSPFGMALVADTLYVANADSVVFVNYESGATSATGTVEHLVDLPAGRNHHWTKSLVAGPNGQFLYVGVGSNSNVAENGMEEERDRAAILKIDVQSGERTVYASGLRNPVGMDWQPQSQELWVAVNERDEIGGDLVPDYMTSVRPGGFYGWPYSYYGQIVDERVAPQRPDLVATAIKPDYALGAHTASLGLTFYDGDMFPGRYRNGAFIGQHGSWNRRPPSGYKVIFIPFASGIPSGPAETVLDGFLSDELEALGRPVGVEVAKDGALLVADDASNIIWRLARQ